MDCYLKVIENKDNIPPEPFTPEIYRDPTFNKWFLRFNARDNQSGIDHYEVLERKEFNLFGLKFNGLSSWIKTESPYLLKDQKLKSYIYVKAFDRANNERISVLVPQVAPAWYENYLIWFIIIILVIISYFVRKNIWRKRLLIR